jgi:DNA-binding NarL/FixJ family response regulator
MEPITVALVDDHRLFRSGIASLINNFPGYKVLFEASNGKDLVARISKKLRPQIILLDLNMPVMDGLETATWLQEHYPEISIIVLSMFDDSEKVLSMISTGVKGYLLKDAEPDEFKKSLDLVAASGVYFPSFVTKHLVQSLSHDYEKNPLNNRELEFIKLACTEMTYKEIAGKMCISVRTVDGYRDALFEKLNIKNRVGLVIYAIKNKLVQI